MVKDPNILLSIVNCKLRDCCKDLEDLSDKLDISVEEIKKILLEINYEYKSCCNQFVKMENRG